MIVFGGNAEDALCKPIKNKTLQNKYTPMYYVMNTGNLSFGYERLIVEYEMIWSIQEFS